MPYKNPLDRRKALQWSFVVTCRSFIQPTADRLWKFDMQSVNFITYTICEDDSGNTILLGFVRFVARVRATKLRSVLGEHCFYKSAKDPMPYLLDIHLKGTPVTEIGHPCHPPKKFMDIVSSFKSAVKDGSLSLVELQITFPFVYIYGSPRSVVRYIQLHNPKILKTTDHAFLLENQS